MPPRNLPWLMAPVVESPAKSRDVLAIPTRRARDDLPSFEETELALQLANAAADAEQPVLNDSNGQQPSSPIWPPDEALDVPKVEYMIEGFDEDDGYMMVEDELYSIAQDFARDLHRQGLVEFKKLAKSRMKELKDRQVLNAGSQVAQVESRRQVRKQAITPKRKSEDIFPSRRSRNTSLTGLLERDDEQVVDLSAIVKKKHVKTKASMLHTAEDPRSFSTSQPREARMNDLNSMARSKQPTAQSMVSTPQRVRNIERTSSSSLESMLPPIRDLQSFGMSPSAKSNKIRLLDTTGTTDISIASQAHSGLTPDVPRIFTEQPSSYTSTYMAKRRADLSKRNNNA